MALARLGENLLIWLTVPRNQRTSLISWGVVVSTMPLVISGSGIRAYPSLVYYVPKKFDPIT